MRKIIEPARETPVIFEKEISRKGNIEDVINAFQIPDTLPDEKFQTEINDNEIQNQNDSTNQS